MAKNVNIRFRAHLPGVGFDSAGNAKQGKTHVMGVINVTAYASGSETVSARDLGLAVVDKASFRVADATGDPGGSTQRLALWDKSTAGFYLVLVGDTGNSNEYATGATETVEFEVVGDSALDVELL